MKNIYIILAGLVILYSCQKDYEEQIPSATFTVDKTTGTTIDNFTFYAMGTSENDYDYYNYQYVIRWDWNGDGVWDTDYSENLKETHQFSSEGEYNVIMEVAGRNTLLKSATNSNITVQKYTPPLDVWYSQNIDVGRAHGLCHIPGDYSKRYVVYHKTCYILNWDFSVTGTSFTCSQITNSSTGDWASGICADENYLYVVTGGKQIERYTHSGSFVDVFINQSTIVNAGFDNDGYFSLCDITIDNNNHLIVTGGPVFHIDNIALFNKTTGQFVSKWNTVPEFPYGITWLSSLNYGSINCNTANGCVVVSQYGTSSNGGQDGFGELYVYSPDGSTFYGKLPTSEEIRQAGLDSGSKDKNGTARSNVLWIGYYAHSKISELIIE